MLGITNVLGALRKCVCAHYADPECKWGWTSDSLQL